MQLCDKMILPVGHLIDPEELLDPIGFLRTEHDERRMFCRRLGALVDDLNQAETAAVSSSLLDFISGKMSPSMAEEEDLLAPLLHQRCGSHGRCGSEDILDAVLDETWQTHALAVLHFPDIVCGLEHLCSGELPGLPLDFIFRSLELIDVLQRHVDLEDFALLPLAEFCLTTDDCEWLGRAIAKRRGIPYPTVH